MSRLWLRGVAITVDHPQADSPVAFVWNETKHTITHVANRWRVDVEWWRFHIWRDYFKVVTSSGLLVVIYHDLLTDQWFVQRLYD